MRDLANNLKVMPVIDPALNTDLGTTPIEGLIIDSLGFEGLMYVISTGTLSDANATYAVLLEEGNENDLADAAAVADADMIGTEAEAGFTFANDGVVRKLGYIGNKRYTRLTITPTGADSGNSPISAIAILGNAHVRPVV